MNTATIVDLFCGGGGESCGIAAAYGRAGISVELHAVNHWERAIETHARHFPAARHYCTGVEALDPCRVVRSGRCDLLWASPECTHHSTARGGRPRSDQSRASAWLVLKWLQELYVRRLIVENVPEFLGWGPLDARGQAMASRKGETFAAWVQALRSLGYRVDWRVLNAADYGAPTTRRRLFVQAVRGGARIVWPEPTHAEATMELLPDARRPWRPAAEVIDWAVPGQRLSERSRPLAEATLRRIETGIRRYWGSWAEPFLVVLRGTGTARPVTRPLPAVTAGGQHLGLVQPFLCRYNGGDGRVHRMDAPVPVVDCGNRYGLVEPFITGIDQQSTRDTNRGVGEPLTTVVTKARHCLVEPFVLGQQSGAVPRLSREPLPTVAAAGAISLVVPYYGHSEASPVGNPLGTVTCKDRFALVQGEALTIDIRFRMLLPHELAGAQGFPQEYQFAGNREEQVRQIGNAVCPPVAEALAAAGIGGAG